MSGVNVPNHYVMQFANTIQTLVQQGESRLRGAVMTGSHTGEQASPVDQVGAVSAQKVIGRFNPMGRVDAPLDRRWVFPQDYDLPQLLDSFDKLRLLIDPTSTYVMNGAMAMGRAMDEEILSGIFGTNKVGKRGETDKTFPSGQVVGVAHGAASATNMTMAKAKKAKELLMAANVNVKTEKLYIGLNAANHTSLLNEIEFTSGDFNGGDAVLKDGRVTQVLGMEVIHTELLQTGTDDAAGTSTQVPVWAKSGVYLGIWDDIFTQISQRNDLQGVPWQAYCKGTFGATRLEEKKVVKIWTR